MKRILLIFLCICLCVSFCACKKTDENAVMSYKGATASQALYSYWMSTYKSNFLDYYNEGIDSNEFWDTLISDDMTSEEFLYDMIENEMKYRTVALWMFDEYKLELPDEVISGIDADIAEKLEYVGSREEINKMLGKFGMNLDMLRDVYIDNAKYEAVNEYLYGNGGTEAPTDKERAAYYNDNYYRLKYIAIYTGATLKTDESGNYVYNEDGQVELIKLSDDEKKVKAQLIDTVMAGIEAGADFDEYIKEFSEVDYSEHPDGFLVSKNDSDSWGTDIVKAAVELKPGEVRMVSDETLTFIVLKCELTEYSKLTSADKKQLEDMDSYIVREKFTAKFDSYAKDVVVNEELKSAFDIREISENSYF